MKRRMLKNCSKARRLVAFLLAAVMVFTCVPEFMTAKASSSQSRSLVEAEAEADPYTLTRPLEIYGENTQNAGKITVGKSVSKDAVEISSEGNDFTFTPEENNFIITYSQTAQVMGLSTEIPVPVDAVFVLDTSGSMDGSRTTNMVTAANKAIKALLETNEHSRVAVVAFSSDNYGGGSASGASANVLSSLAHYDTDTDHLTWVDYTGDASEDGEYIAGRDQVTYTYTESGRPGRPGQQVTKVGNAFRHGSNGGTHIQAGITLGAQQLMAESNNPVVTIDGKQFTRMPFLIVLSDGQPTYSADEENWYNLDINEADQQGPGSGAYEGNGFLAALTAAYYKGAITDKYFGSQSSDNNRCFVYTIGLNIDSINNGDENGLAKLTLDPKTYATGKYASGDGFTENNRYAYSYYYYGNSHNDNYRSTDNSFRTYWNQYSASQPADFDIRVHYNDTYTVKSDTISETKNYVNGFRTVNGQAVGMGYTGGLLYNDDHFSANSDGSAELEAAFDKLVRTIQLKAIAAPTQVTGLADFDGYVHYSDPIGEYMEVKNVHGVVNDGYNFRGAKFAELLKVFNTANADMVFDDALRSAMKGRQGMTDEQINAFVAAAVSSANQANYTSKEDFDNSLVWWGKSYQVDGVQDDDAHAKIQYLAPADNDTVEFIEGAKSAGSVPEGADVVCRSYYFYGTAGGELDTPVTDALLFAVRVQRSLEAPYKETMIVSIPASLLCVEKVLITQKGLGENATYIATVEKDSAVRLVYEVGLRSDINAQNVIDVVDDAYASEKTAHDNGVLVGKDNVEVDEDGNATYYFYTNDWDRTKTESSHLRAMTKVSYDSAPDNDFYRYQADTAILDANGNPVTGSLPNDIYYYARTVYDWEGNTLKSDGTYDVTKKTVLIPVRLSSETDGVEQKPDGSWYIVKGGYTAATLLVTGDDVAKDPNKTETSAIVTHPVRTNDHLDSHYTVYLGNNGRLALVADKTKTVGVNVDDSATATTITDQDGNVVTVGDVLTYFIKVVNNEGEDATAVVTDMVPIGTELVEGSISDIENCSIDGQGKITWNLNLKKDEVKYVSFKVTVTKAALQGVSGALQNTASVQIGNSPAYNTNTTKNPPIGKVVAGENVDISENGQNGIQVGQTLIYHIYWTNGEDTPTDVVITDVIPEGTQYVVGSATDNGEYNSADQTLKWTLEDVQPGASGVVTFKVIVDATAKTPIENGAKIQIGDNSPVVDTNPTEVEVLKGNLILSKVVENGGTGYADKVFTLELATSGSQMGSGYGKLNGEYQVEGSSLTNIVKFTDGVATVQIKDGESLTIKDLPAGMIIVVTEKNVPNGYTPNYSVANGQIKILPGTDAAVPTVKVTNVYAANPIEFQLKGSKTLVTDDFFQGTTFTAIVERYTVDAATGEWKPNGEVATTAQTSVSSDNKGGEFVFAKKIFTKADIGEHYYLITEFNNNVNGVDYDATQYRMKLVVADNGEGQLTVTPTIWKKAEGASDFTQVNASVNVVDGVVTVSDAVAFTNEYQPIETSIVLEGTKKLVNRTLQNNEFGFEVIEVINGKEVVVSTGLNDKNGAIKFQPIVYTVAGPHTYKIREVNGQLANVAYDKAEYTVTVEVKDVQGRLQATAAYPAGGVVFTNTYAPGDAEVPLSGTKTLTGRTQVEGEFTFEVLDAAGNVVSTGQNGADGTITFNPIVIKHDTSKAGSYTETFTYTVKEAIPVEGAKDPYMGYDETIYTIQVNVSYDAEKGVLTATAANSNPALNFTNEQYPSSVIVTPVGSKTTFFPDRTVADLPDATFSFSVVNAQTGVEATTGIGKANGNVVFGSLTFRTPGTYNYWIKESNAGLASNGITYDADKFLMKVVVSEKMVPSVSYWACVEGGDADKTESYTVPVSVPAFENTYAASGSINITANKVLSGDRDLQNNEFAFKLVRQDNGREIDGLADAEGKITFATMYYSSADLGGEKSKVITYTMSEVVPEVSKIPGVTYDTKEHSVSVKLTDDGNGNIIAELLNADGTVKGSNDTGITFFNVYKPTEGTSATMTVAKQMNGRDLADDEFTFELYFKNGAAETLVTTATNKNGKVSFTRNYLPEAVVFPEGQDTVTYEYVIREQAGNLGGVTYATNAVGVRVTVKNDIEQGKLVLVGDPQYFDYVNGAFTTAITEPKFVNEYKAEGTSVTPQATKVMSGRTMKDDEFSFEVTKINSDNTLGERVSVGLSKSNGTVVFTPIGYSDRPGAGQSTINRYMISEVAGSRGGVTYSDAKYYLKVVVTDAGIGELDAVYTYHTDIDCTSQPIDVSKVVFENVYNTQIGIAQLSADKILTGRDMADKEFDFVVKDENGKVVAYGDNAAAKDGQAAPITFTTISYSLADMAGQDDEGKKDFYYTISEVAPLDGHVVGVKTDSLVYKAKVTVTDNKDGVLIVGPIEYFNAAGQKIDKVTFKNTYEADDAKLTLTANKILKEKVLWANEFSFVLKDKDGNILKDAAGRDIIVSNNADGLIVFPELTFTEAAEYIYYVEEVASVNDIDKVDGEMEDNYYFDPTSYKVVVKVTDDKVGKLHAKATYYKADSEVQNISFANMYTPDPVRADLSTVIGATKSVVDASGNAVEYPLAGFKFAVKDIYGNDVMTKDASGNPVPVIGTSGADGKITFNSFTFDKADEYYYWISEIPSDKGGITDDTRQWSVHIHVKHNPDAEGITDVNGNPVAIGKLYVSEVGIFEVSAVDGANTVSTNASAPEFVNVYHPAPVKLTVQADKYLSGRELKDREFIFNLMEGNLILAEARNDADGNITFTIDIATAGRHTYTIKEVIPEQKEDCITYDANGVATITVDVVDDHSGQLKIENRAEITKDDKGYTFDTDYTFNNIYTPNSTSAIVSAIKTLKGRILGANAYTFELVELDASGAEIDPPMTATNDADGNIIFDKIVFTAADMVDAQDNVVDQITKNYVLREQIGTEKNVTYDDSVCNVTIVVTDDKVGQLHAEVTYDTEAGAIPEFVNTYKKSTPKTASFTLTGTKKLLGGTMIDDQFKFLVYNEDGILAGSGTNKADGTIEFTTMTTSKSGKEVLTIVEEAGSDKNITYDVRKIQVTVEVIAEHGNLKAVVHYPEGGLVFTNIYSGYVAPATGDNSPIMLMLAALLVCGGGLSGLLVWRKKREEN